MALQFERCAVGAFAEEIKALFVRNDAAGFPTFYERAYSRTASAGGISWIARDGQGKLVGHYAALPRAFRTAVVPAGRTVAHLNQVLMGVPSSPGRDRPPGCRS